MSYTGVSLYSLWRAAATLPTTLRSLAEHGSASSSADLEAFDQDRQAAWKYVGYPGLCKWLVSPGKDLSVRRFEELNARVILKKQDEIVQVERELHRMDSFTRCLPDDRGGCGSLRLDADTPRGELLDEAAILLQDYNSRLAVLAQIRALPRTSKSSVHDLQQWLNERPNVLEAPELEFVEAKDLINLVSSHPMLCETRIRWWSGLGSILMLLGPMWLMGIACAGTQRLVIVSLFELALGMLLILVARPKAGQQATILAVYFAILLIAQALLPSLPLALPDSYGNQWRSVGHTIR